MNTPADLAEKLSPGRLQWACRRGMLELDILLGDFVRLGYDRLTVEERTVFHKLLVEQDQDLYEMCMGLQPIADEKIQHVIEKIRNTASHPAQGVD